MSDAINFLIVEDDKTTEKVIASFINRYALSKNWGINLQAMSDPVQALFELTSAGDKYGIVLLDVRLPGLSGDEIYNSLEHVMPDILDRILFITGYPDDLKWRFPDRRLNVLQKPFLYKEFARKLDVMLA